QILPQLAKCEAEVLGNGFPAEGNESVALLPNLSGIAELSHRCEMSLLRRHSRGDEVLLRLFAMKGHLFIELGAKAIATEENGELCSENGEQVHPDLQ